MRVLCCICKKELTPLTQCCILTYYGKLIEACDGCMLKNKGTGVIDKGEWKYYYHQYLKSDAWKALRKIALTKAKNKCEKCGKKATQVHYINYDVVYDWFSTSNLIALCKPCHQEIHRVCK